MILLVSGATATLRGLPADAPVGHLITPHTGNRIDLIATGGRPWAGDNGCGPKSDGTPGALDEPALWAMLRAIERAVRLPGARRPLWVVCPDAVGDWRATRALWARWWPILRSLDIPLAYVLQDGQPLYGESGVPWTRAACLFIGGSTAYKESREAEAAAAEAKRRGLSVHLGRCNSERRLRLFDAVGVDTLDGTQFSMFPDTYIPRWAERLRPALRGQLARRSSDPLPMFADYEEAA
jgi:hypothetical protein